MSETFHKPPYTFLDVSSQIIESFLELILEAARKDMDSDKIIQLTDALAQQVELFLSAQKNCRDFNNCECHNTFANLEKNIPELVPFVHETIERDDPEDAIHSIRNWLDIHIYANSHGCPNCSRNIL